MYRGLGCLTTPSPLPTGEALQSLSSSGFLLLESSGVSKADVGDAVWGKSEAAEDGDTKSMQLLEQGSSSVARIGRIERAKQLDAGKSSQHSGSSEHGGRGTGISDGEEDD